ncbi:MAG: aminotransferase class III-fold pyridoxal phosphate-dependent enzyme, partial [Nitrososphaeraceae archaeon]
MNGEDQYLANLYQRFPINIAAGKAAKVWDTSGNEYIDCMGGYGVALIGHSNDKVIKAIKDQAEKLIACHMSVYNDTRLNFLHKLSSIAPEGLSKTFFSNSGAEAVEAAL